MSVKKSKKNVEIAEKIIKAVEKEKKSGTCKICNKEYKNLDQHYTTDYHNRRLPTTKDKKIKFKSSNRYQAGMCPICNIVVSNISDHKKNKHKAGKKAELETKDIPTKIKEKNGDVITEKEQMLPRDALVGEKKVLNMMKDQDFYISDEEDKKNSCSACLEKTDKDKIIEFIKNAIEEKMKKDPEGWKAGII